MPPNEALEIKIDRALFRKSYSEFFRAAWEQIDTDPLVMQWYITYICNRLQTAIERVVNGEKRIKHIAISLPPRTGKSSIISKQLIPWAWGPLGAPWLKFITATYGDRLSEELSISSKTLIETDWYQNRFGHVYSFSEKKNTNTYYLNNKGGWRLAVSAGVPISGSGCNVAIGDDLLDPFLAYSEAERKMVIRWIRTVFTRRLNRKEIDLIILLQQRAHVDDPIGWVEKNLPDDFEIISIPAELGYSDVKPPELEQFYVNGLMDPIRFSRSVLELEKSIMLTQDYDAQYLQSPKKIGGNIFQRKYFPTYNPIEVFNAANSTGVKLITHFTGDTAYTKNQNNSATVFMGGFVFNGKLHIVNRLKVWEEITELVSYQIDDKKQEGLLERFVNENGYSKDSLVSIEPKASGLDIISTIRKFTDLNVDAYEHKDTDKLTSARSVLPLIKAGKVLLPYGAEWLGDFYDSIEAFNGDGKGSDEVDALIMLIRLYLLNEMDNNKVFSYSEIKEFVKDEPGNTWIGVNFGYTNNETSIVKVVRDEPGKKLYVHEMFSKEGMDIADVIFKLNAWKTSKSIPIVCNSLEKKQIAEIKKAGYNVNPVQVGREGDYLSVTTIKNYELFVTTASGVLLKELAGFVWEIESATGKTTNKTLGKAQSIGALKYVALYGLNRVFKKFKPMRLGNSV